MAAALTDRIIVTGATGLIGSWFTDLWPSSGSRLMPIGSADVDLLSVGAGRRLLERERPQGLVHLAWCASGTPGYRHSSDNDAWVRTSLELATTAEGMGVRCWFTGSVVDEPSMVGVAGADRYTQGKARLRDELGDSIETGAIGWFQPTYVIDPQRGRPELVAQAVTAAASGEPLTLRTPSDSHDFVHAADVAQAMILAVLEQRTGLLQMGAGRSRTVAELASRLGATWVPEPTHRPTQQHSSAVADVRWLRELGWSPRWTEELFDMDQVPRRQT